MLCIWARVAAAASLYLAAATAAGAHPVPFSFIDVRLEGGAAHVTVVAHVFDLAHELKVEPVESLLTSEALARHSAAMTAMVGARLRLSADGGPLAPGPWGGVEPLAERQSIRFTARVPLAQTPGRLTVAAEMFPYDPEHKTFLNVYDEHGIAAQAILDRGRTSFDYFTGTRQGYWAVLRRFVPAGVHHILIGPDHLMFLAGLLLLGGTIKQLLLVVTAFTIAHSLTLSLAALRIVIPPAGAIEPAIALSVVYVGADNLLVRGGGRDTRAWVAFVFGLIHGFGFASVLGEMDLPARALGWSLFGFNLGVEAGQIVVVAVVAGLFGWIRSRSEAAGRRLAVAGSIVVMMSGVYWFVQRVFFGGTV